MVICVGCNPWAGVIKLYNFDKKIFKIFDVDKFETNPEDTNLRKFFEKINEKIKQPIDYFCIYFKSCCTGKFHQDFITTAEKYYIKEIKIIGIHQLMLIGAINGLSISPKQGDLLWIFDLQESLIECCVWEYSMKNRWRCNSLHIRETTKFETNASGSIEDLKSLISKNENKSVKPYIMVFHIETKINEKDVSAAFGTYRKIKFAKLWDCSAWAHDYARYFQEKLKFEKYRSVSVLDRNIKIRMNEKIIIQVTAGTTLPLEENEIIYPKKSYFLKVYENNLCTEELHLDQEKVQEVMLKIDINGIHKIFIKGLHDEEDMANLNLIPIVRGHLHEIARLNSWMNDILTKYIIRVKTVEYDSRFNAVGIDLGCTSCCTAVIRRNGPECVVLDPITTLRTMPSYIAFDEKIPKCGQIAIDRMKYKAAFTVFDIKRIMGKRFESIAVDSLWPFKVINTENGTMIEVETCNGKKTKSPEEILAVFLTHIKKVAETFQGRTLKDAVITIPFDFTSTQKQSIMIAAKYAGWKAIHFLPEPVAAIFAYFSETKIANNSRILIFDFGGDTCNVCIAHIVNYHLNILKYCSDSYMGGKDFDNLLFNYFNGILKHKYKIDVIQNNKKNVLMQKCQSIKCTLSAQEYCWLDVNDFHPEKESIIPITRHDFEEMAQLYKLRITNQILKIVDEADLKNEQIDFVFQVGGGCRMPIIKNLLINLFPTAFHTCSFNPDWAVAEGAAIYAYYLKTT